MKDSPSFRIKVPSFISTKQNAWFFQRLGEPVEFRADQLIAVPGSYPRYSYFLKSGRVIAGIVNSSNHQRLMLSFEESSLLLEQYQLTGKPCDLYYRAVTDCVAQMISYHDLTQAMKADFSVTLDVLNAISDLGAMSLKQRMFETASARSSSIATSTQEVSRMEIERYAAQRENYPMPEDAAGVGTAADRESGNVIAIGVVTRRKTYSRAGYLCQKGAPPELHAAASALLELSRDMPVIKTVLLRPEEVCERICGGEAPPPELLRCAALALAALRQALSGCLAEKTDID